MPETLWIVDPSLEVAETEGARTVAEAWGGPARVFLPALRPGDEPEGYDATALVVLGSAASVEDTFDWLGRLSAWLAPVVRGEVRRPLLAVCFGHQLLAHLAGGRVAFNREDRAKRVGVESCAPAGSSRWLGDARLRVVVSHREQVVEPPPGFRTVGTRPGVPHDAIEHESLPLYGTQFHPEARGEFAARAGIPPAEIDARLIADSDGLLRRFAERARAAPAP